MDNFFIILVVMISLCFICKLPKTEPFISQYSQQLHCKTVDLHDLWDKQHRPQFFYHRYYVPFDDKNY